MSKKEKKFIIDFPNLMEEWNYDKNNSSGFYPDKISYGSAIKVWWVCNVCKNEWQANPNHRSRGRGCPLCSEKQRRITHTNTIVKKRGSLTDNYPEIAKEWHTTKNKKTPYEISSGTNKKFWWICEKGHEWKAAVSSRRRAGCPVCSGYSVLIGYNDLETLNPKLAKEYHPTKNKKPITEVAIGSSEKVWWICEKGHEWRATPAHRKDGTGCPVCSNRKIITGVNDLETLNPRLASEWHPTKNGDITPKNVGVHDNTIFWWICEKGHEWRSSITNRTKGNGCRKCSSELQTSFPEQAIYFYIKQITETHNRYLIKGKMEIDIYLPKYNLGIEYDGLRFHKGEKVKQREERKEELLKEKGIYLIRVKESKTLNKEEIKENVIYTSHVYGDANINKMLIAVIDKVKSITGITNNVDVNIERDRTKIHEQYIQLKKENSLAIKNPELAREWHGTKNGSLTPYMFSVSSNKKVFWLCPKNEKHVWDATISSRNSGVGCPYCSGKKVLAGDNDLATTYPELASEWHSTENGVLTPKDVTAGSNKIVFWLCPKNEKHVWDASINARCNGRGCPYCSGKKVLVGDNDLATTHPELASEWHSTENGVLTPKDVTAGSDKIVWWLCKNCGHEWKTHVCNRKAGKGCPQCAELVRGKTLRKKIYQYTIDGVFVNEYESITKAGEITGIKNIYPYTKRKMTHGGFIWIDKKDDSLALQLSKTINPNKYKYNNTAVLQFTLDGEFVERYSNSKEAEIKNNISRSKVGECCRGKRKTAGGYIWKYDI